MNFKFKLLISSLLLIWFFAHIPGIVYGTKNIPMHQSYVGDEQSPVNGALHILQDRSLLGLRNAKTVYYGPIFSVIALPGILLDFSNKYLSNLVNSAEEYKNTIIWDWGGIILNNRVIAVLFSIIGILFIYKIFYSVSINPRRNIYLALFCTILVAFNYYFFQYSHFFKHWSFVMIFLIGQIYFSIRMYEVKALNKWHWFWHGLLFVLSFGVSYFSILYQIAFIPFIYKFVIKGEAKARRYFLNYLIFTTISCGLIIWWHPYAFIRLLGIAGFGEMSGALNNSQNPFVLSFDAFGYYLREIVFNQISIIIITLILSIFFFIKRGLNNFYYIWIIYSIAIINFFLFALAEHYEGRYMLPTILMIIFGSAILFLKYLEHAERNRYITLSVITLFIFYLVSHIGSIVKWVDIWSNGPLEKSMIDNVIELQKDGPVLLVQNYIAGQVHTKESYLDYAKRFGKADFNLYKQILATNLPDNVPQLNVIYVTSADFSNSMDNYIKRYKHVIYKYEPRSNEINQFDYMDENILRIWSYYDYSPSYFLIK